MTWGCTQGRARKWWSHWHYPPMNQCLKWQEFTPVIGVFYHYIWIWSSRVPIVWIAMIDGTFALWSAFPPWVLCLHACACVILLLFAQQGAQVFQLLVHGTMSHFILTLTWPHTMTLFCSSFSTVPAAKSSPKCQRCNICWQNTFPIFSES